MSTALGLLGCNAPKWAGPIGSVQHQQGVQLCRQPKLCKKLLVQNGSILVQFGRIVKRARRVVHKDRLDRLLRPAPPRLWIDHNFVVEGTLGASLKLGDAPQERADICGPPRVQPCSRLPVEPAVVSGELIPLTGPRPARGPVAKGMTGATTVTRCATEDPCHPWPQDDPPAVAAKRGDRVLRLGYALRCEYDRGRDLHLVFSWMVQGGGLAALQAGRSSTTEGRVPGLPVAGPRPGSKKLPGDAGAPYGGTRAELGHC